MYVVIICFPEEDSITCESEQEIKDTFLALLEDTKRDRWYDFMCFAHRVPEEGYKDPTTTEGKVQYLQHLEGNAIFRKHAGKLSVVKASGVFVGLLERLAL